jgi:hypothetical protein
MVGVFVASREFKVEFTCRVVPCPATAPPVDAYRRAYGDAPATDAKKDPARRPSLPWCRLPSSGRGGHSAVSQYVAACYRPILDPWPLSLLLIYGR